MVNYSGFTFDIMGVPCEFPIGDSSNSIERMIGWENLKATGNAKQSGIAPGAGYLLIYYVLYLGYGPLPVTVESEG